VWQRLDLAEQDVFARLSVFQGDCTREAAETVCGATLRILHSLVSRSLLTHTRQGRYHLHQLLRQYAQMQLDEVQQAALRTAHMDYYMQFVYERGQRFYSGGYLQVMRELEDELDNIRAALRWAIQIRSRDALHKVAEMMPYYDSRGLWHEALDVFTQALEVVGPDSRDLTAARIRQVIALCGSRLRRLNNESFTEETVRIFEELGEYSQCFVVRDLMAHYAVDRGDFASARDIMDRSLTLARENNDPMGMRHALQTMGIISTAQGDFARGEQELLESTRIAQQFDDIYTTAFNLHNMGDTVLYLGDVARARALYEESHDLAREMNNIPLIHANLLYLARLVYNQGEYDTAGRLLAEAREFENEIGENQIGKWGLLSLIAFQAGDYAQACEYLCTAFSEEGFYIQLYSHFRLPLVEAVINVLVVAERCTAAVTWLAFSERHPTSDPLARQRLQVLAEQIEQALDAEVYADAWERGQQINAETLVEEFVTVLCLGRRLS
jgi:tetratricopeptide (TPR) repeat protein